MGQAALLRPMLARLHRGLQKKEIPHQLIFNGGLYGNQHHRGSSLADFAHHRRSCGVLGSSDVW